MSAPVLPDRKRSGRIRTSHTVGPVKAATALQELRQNAILCSSKLQEQQSLLQQSMHEEPILQQVLAENPELTDMLQPQKMDELFSALQNPEDLRRFFDANPQLADLTKHRQSVMNLRQQLQTLRQHQVRSLVPDTTPQNLQAAREKLSQLMNANPSMTLSQLRPQWPFQQSHNFPPVTNAPLPSNHAHPATAHWTADSLPFPSAVSSSPQMQHACPSSPQGQSNEIQANVDQPVNNKPGNSQALNSHPGNSQAVLPPPATTQPINHPHIHQSPTKPPGVLTGVVPTPAGFSTPTKQFLSPPLPSTPSAFSSPSGAAAAAVAAAASRASPLHRPLPGSDNMASSPSAPFPHSAKNIPRYTLDPLAMVATAAAAVQATTKANAGVTVGLAGNGVGSLSFGYRDVRQDDTTSTTRHDNRHDKCQSDRQDKYRDSHESNHLGERQDSHQSNHQSNHQNHHQSNHQNSHQNHHHNHHQNHHQSMRSSGMRAGMAAEATGHAAHHGAATYRNLFHENRSSGTQHSGNQPHGSHSQGYRSTGNPSFGNQPNESQSHVNQSHGNQCHGNQSHGSQPHGNQSHGNEPYGSHSHASQLLTNRQHGSTSAEFQSHPTHSYRSGATACPQHLDGHQHSSSCAHGHGDMNGHHHGQLHAGVGSQLGYGSYGQMSQVGYIGLYCGEAEAKPLDPRTYYEAVQPSDWTPPPVEHCTYLYSRAYFWPMDVLFPPLWFCLGALLCGLKPLPLWVLLLLLPLSFILGMELLVVQGAGVPRKQLALSKTVPSFVVSCEVAVLLVTGWRMLPVLLYGGTWVALQAGVLLLLTMAGMMLHWWAATTDPGMVDYKKDEAPGADSAAGIKLTVQPGGPALPECWTCRVPRPLRSKHCAVCGRCVSRFDHHCNMLPNCVGAANQTLFSAFIFTTLLVLTLFLKLSWQYSWLRFAMLAQQHQASSTWRTWLLVLQRTSSTTPEVLLLQFLVFPLTGFVSFLAARCMLLISGNLTTNELVNRHRYPYLNHETAGFCNRFDWGVWKNWRQFLGGQQKIDWWREFESGDKAMRHKNMTMLSTWTVTYLIRLWDYHYQRVQERVQQRREERRERRIQQALMRMHQDMD